MLEDDAAARFYALNLIRKLKKDDPTGFMGWALDVTEGKRLVCSIPFHKPN